MKGRNDCSAQSGHAVEVASSGADDTHPVRCELSGSESEPGQGETYQGGKVNKLLEFTLEEAAQGRAEYTYRAVDMSVPCVASYFDASLGREDNCRSQAGMETFATSEKVLTQMTNANLVEHHGNKITRVVKSSLAAEACSMSMTVDKHLYTRLLWQALMFGERNIEVDWRQSLRIQVT